MFYKFKWENDHTWVQTEQEGGIGMAIQSRVGSNELGSLEKS